MADEFMDVRWIQGVNVPLCFRRLNALHFHDAEITRLEKSGGEVVLEIVRRPMPWAPGPVGNFCLRFHGVERAAFISRTGKTVELDSLDKDREQLDSAGGMNEWLYSGVSSVLDGRCVYEIDTTWGLISIESNTATLEAIPRFSRVELQNNLASLKGAALCGFQARFASPDVWLKFRIDNSDSDDVISLGVACEFEFRSHDGGKSNYLDLDSGVNDRHSQQSLFEEQTRVFRSNIATGGILVDSVDVLEELGIFIRFNDGGSFHAVLPKYSASGSGAGCSWWAIHIQERNAALLVTP